MASFISNTYSTAESMLSDTGFFLHLTAYLLVNAILIVINVLFTPQTLWFIWPLMGWGIGILAHGTAVFFDSR